METELKFAIKKKDGTTVEVSPDDVLQMIGHDGEAAGAAVRIRSGKNTLEAGTVADSRRPGAYIDGFDHLGRQLYLAEAAIEAESGVMTAVLNPGYALLEGDGPAAGLACRLGGDPDCPKDSLSPPVKRVYVNEEGACSGKWPAGKRLCELDEHDLS